MVKKYLLSRIVEHSKYLTQKQLVFHRVPRIAERGFENLSSNEWMKADCIGTEMRPHQPAPPKEEAQVNDSLCRHPGTAVAMEGWEVASRAWEISGKSYHIA